MKKLPLFLIALSWVLFVGCNPEPDLPSDTENPDSATTISNLIQRVAALEVQNSDYEATITNLTQRVSTLEANNSERAFIDAGAWPLPAAGSHVLEADNSEWAAIDPASQAYQELQTPPFGVLLVSTKSVTPYLDGYKVKAAIGNPYNVTFGGFRLAYQVSETTLTPTWARHAVGPTIEDRTETLQAGSWTDIEFTIAPATADDIRKLWISIHLEDVQLNEIPNPQ